MKKQKKKQIRDKQLKILKYITIALLAVLLIEVIYFGYKMIKIRQTTTYYTALNSIIKTEAGYVGVGFSDFKHSDFNKYQEKGYNKPCLWVYDKNLNITKEIKFDKGYNGAFNEVIEVEDGYIVVGNIQMTEYNFENNTKEATIIKYDKDLNLVWRKNYDLLGDTTFNSVKELEDGNLLVVGSSIYENNVIGNHTNGGAIVVKFDKDGEKLLEINHGGPRTGSFTDVEIVEDGFIVVGVKSNNTGIIFKYNFEGKEIWHNYHGYTDTAGLSSITRLSDDEFVITGSKLENKDDTENYKAALIKINSKGKITDTVIYGKDKISRFEDSVLLGDKLYVIGLYGKQIDNVLDNDSVLVTYDKELRQQDEKTYIGDNKYTLTTIIDNDGNYLLAGNTNSKIKNLKTNGKDYYQIIVEE